MPELGIEEQGGQSPVCPYLSHAGSSVKRNRPHRVLTLGQNYLFGLGILSWKNTQAVSPHSHIQQGSGSIGRSSPQAKSKHQERQPSAPGQERSLLSCSSRGTSQMGSGSLEPPCVQQGITYERARKK